VVGKGVRGAGEMEKGHWGCRWEREVDIRVNDLKGEIGWGDAHWGGKES